MRKRGNRVRERILEEATRLVGERGYEGASLRDMAAASGVPLSTLRHHFTSREALLEEVTRGAIDVFKRRVIDAVEADGTPQERLQSYVSNIVELLLSDLPEVKVVDRELQLLDHEALGQMAVQSIIAAPEPNASVARLMRATGSEILDVVSAKRLGDILFATLYGTVKLRPIHYHETGPAFVTHAGIVRDVLAIFSRALGFVEISTPDIGRFAEFARLGELVSEQRRLEGLLRKSLLRRMEIEGEDATLLVDSLPLATVLALLKQRLERDDSAAGTALRTAIKALPAGGLPIAEIPCAARTIADAIEAALNLTAQHP